MKCQAWKNLAVKTVFHIHDNWYCGQNKEYWPGCLFIYIKDQKQIGALYLASRLLVSKNRLHEMKSRYNSQLPRESLWTICKNKRYKVFVDSVLYTSGIWLLQIRFWWTKLMVPAVLHFGLKNHQILVSWFLKGTHFLCYNL